MLQIAPQFATMTRLSLTLPAVSAAGDDDELDDQKAAAVETAIAAPDTVADFDLGAYHARLARDNAPTVCWRAWLAVAGPVKPGLQMAAPGIEDSRRLVKLAYGIRDLGTREDWEG